MRASESSPVVLGLICLAAGLGITGVGLGLIPVDPTTVHAPMWVLALCGLVFVMSGVAVLAARWPRIQSAAGGTIVLVFGIVGGWVALFGESGQFSGGLPFVPPGVNMAIARGMFGLGAVLCFALFAWGTSRLLRGEVDA